MKADLERRLMMKGALSVAMTSSALILPHSVQAQSKPKLSTLRSNARSWLWSAEDYAQHQQLFDKSGLSVELAATNRGVNQDALLSGAADVLLGSPATNMRVQLLGRPVKMICGWVNKFASNVVVKKSILDKTGVTESSSTDSKIVQLRGLRIGTTGPGAGPDQLLRYFLSKGKIDPDRDVQLVTIQGGASAMLAAFDRGQIDAFCLSSPTSDLAVTKFGGAYLFNMVTNPPPELNDFLYIAASVTEQTAKEKPNELIAYCRGIALALRAIDKDRNSFKTFAKEYFKDLDSALFEPVFANNVGMYMKNPTPTKKHFDINVEFLNVDYRSRKQPEVATNFKFEDSFELKFVEKALQGL